VREKFRVDPLPVIANGDRDLVAACIEDDLDGSVLRGEFDRVDEQIPHHLLHPFRVAGHFHVVSFEPRFEPHGFRFRLRADDPDRFLDDGARRRRGEIERKIPGDQARHV
jgi:hypothetical protein